MKTYRLDHLTPMQKTLLITLKGRAVDNAEKAPVLGDSLAAELVDRLDYDTDTVKLTLGVPLAIAIRSRMLDRAVDNFVRDHPDAVVVELGCGLETRMSRLDPPATVDWYDIDFPEVVELRKAMLPQRDNAHPIGVSLLDRSWTDAIPADRPTILVGDGLFGFLTESENKQVLTRITDHFTGGELVFNAYTKLVARMNGRYTRVVGMPPDYRGFGINEPRDVVTLNSELTFLEEQFGDASPEAEQLTVPYRLLGRLFARWRGQARRGVWVVRYRF